MTDSNYLGNFWGNQSGFVEQVSTPTTLPTTASTAPSQVFLAWASVPAAIRYVVYCGTTANRLVVQADNLQTTAFTIQNLMPRQTYYVQVVAVLSTSSAISSLFPSGMSVQQLLIPHALLLIDPTHFLLIDDVGSFLSID